MKIIKPSYEILTPIGLMPSMDILSAIELAGRTCYKSEDKMDETSHKNFVKMIINKGHESVLEHKSLTIKFICDRGVSHELVRHRIASYSQESTRYCNYSKDKFENQLTFIIPNWLPLLSGKVTNKNYAEVEDQLNDDDLAGSKWLAHMSSCETTYNRMIEQGWTPQEARSILPNSLKTEIVVTANLRQWREIFRQRTAKAAHPQMRELMCPLLDELKEKLPVVFDDIDYER